ncbi:EpsG family protein [Flavobacterium swingsii]|jgi:hypothetical protein|uniref:EpsG family protein n=1 Tax=Flavobacterium swingsii TaxID=498292 RepID=A0A1I0Z932_9FLAO|nr:EpsG family protein [Flavobacterium swingsii]SFB20733.1 EpsG family protein [Flavobacterium swingsii]
MIVNLSVIFLILFFGFVFYNIPTLGLVNSSSNRKRYIRIICFILILQSGLRNVAVGEDTYTYYLAFNDISRTSWENVRTIFFDYFRYGIGKDPGFIVFQKFFQIFSNDFQVFLFFVAFLFFTAFGRFLYKNTSKISDLIIAFFMYSIMFYTFYSYTGIRQTIATAILLLGYEFLKKKRMILYFLVILLASFFHKSALIFILFYFLSYIKNAKILTWSVLLLFPILLFFSDTLSTYFIAATNSYSEYEATEKYRPITFIVLMLVLTFVGALNYDRIIKINPDARLYFIAFSIAIFFMAFVLQIHGYMRVVQYFSFFMVLFIPEILKSFERFSKKIKNEVTILTMIVLISLFLKANFTQEVRYGFFWEEMRLPNHYFVPD